MTVVTAGVAQKPAVLIFDVNETLLDLESLTPLFKRLFGTEQVMREWFNSLILYSMTITLSGVYTDFLSLGGGVLRMLGGVHGIAIEPSDVAQLEEGLRTMPAHKDAADGLRMLKDAGFRLVTLTNSPSSSSGRSPLDHAGLSRYFERQFTVDAVRAFKSSPVAYGLVTLSLQVPPSSCCLVAAHVWDTIGAQSAGMGAALITRPGNALLPAAALPQPTVVGRNLPEVAARLIEHWRS
jgi:2-haloacid dehalogenase